MKIRQDTPGSLANHFGASLFFSEEQNKRHHVIRRSIRLGVVHPLSITSFTNEGGQLHQAIVYWSPCNANLAPQSSSLRICDPTLLCRSYFGLVCLGPGALFVLRFRRLELEYHADHITSHGDLQQTDV